MLDKITRVRNCAVVMVSSTWAIERAEMATSKRDVVSNASVIKSTESSCAAAFSVGIGTPPSGPLGVVLAPQRLQPGNILAVVYCNAEQLFPNATVVYGVIQRSLH
jgi:hypothetical protein